MVFSPFVVSSQTGERIPVQVVPAVPEDIAATSGVPKWQTDWGSDYLSDPSIEKIAVKTDNSELVGLGAYQIRGNKAFVFIVYMESAPHSNPVLQEGKQRKYYGIGALLIAVGIKYSIDHGCRGDVVFEAKTEELAEHYESDFHAIRIADEFSGGPKRYLLADEDAWNAFSQFLKEDAE